MLFYLNNKLYINQLSFAYLNHSTCKFTSFFEITKIFVKIFSKLSIPENKQTTQIDLVIDRNDHVINLCEMKYSKDEYAITKEYNDTLRSRYAIFTDATKTRKTVHTTMITTFGVKRNQYWGNIQSEVRLNELFAF